MMIKCIAIDDEPLALKQISLYIDKTPYLEAIAMCRSAFEAMEYLVNTEVDLMFVDINMPDLNGMDFVKSLTQKPQIIFTTAYSEFAIQGFEVDALDYILKPISYNVFLKSANKAKTWFELNLKQIRTQIQTDSVQTTQDSLFVKSEYKMVRIFLSEIKYIESSNEYIQIHLINDEPVTTLIRLKVMEEQLPKNKFMRVHRSFIVNLDRIKVIERNRIVFDHNVYIPVGEQYKEGFQAFVDKTFLL